MNLIIIVATTRERDCEKSSPIATLVSEQLYRGTQDHQIKSLKSEADAGLVASKCPRTGKLARVRIFQARSTGRWIATTRADEMVCDNLLTLAIFRRISMLYGTDRLDSCPLR